jgi:hypothetical protein
MSAPLPPVGRQPASPPAATSSAEDLIPGDIDRPLGIEIAETTIELDTLGRSERKRPRSRSEAIPQLLEQIEPFLGCQRRDVDVTLTHIGSIVLSRRNDFVP